MNFDLLLLGDIGRIEVSRRPSILNAYETFGTFTVAGRAPGNPVERFLTPAPPISVFAGVQYAF